MSPVMISDMYPAMQCGRRHAVWVGQCVTPCHTAPAAPGASATCIVSSHVLAHSVMSRTFAYTCQTQE